MKVDQSEVRIVVLGGGDRIVSVVRDRDDPVAGVILDQIFKRRR